MQYRSPPSRSESDLDHIAALRRINSSDASLWERLERRGQTIGIRNRKGDFVPLSLVGDEDLPPLQRRLPALGRFLTRHSLFARILARRVGKEEVTFYSLLNQPEGEGIARWLDRRLLRVGGPPLNWRREQVVRTVREALERFGTAQTERFVFWDIGAGAGFDSLDVARQFTALEAAGRPVPDYRLVNVDVDRAWLERNESLTREFFDPPVDRHFVRRAESIFEYLGSERQRADLMGARVLLISCNGFADFLELADLQRLLEGIHAAIPETASVIWLVMPMATRNRLQETLSRAIGFEYRARNPGEFLKIALAACPSLHVTTQVRHSQIVFHLRRAPGEPEIGASGIAP